MFRALRGEKIRLQTKPCCVANDDTSALGRSKIVGEDIAPEAIERYILKNESL